MYSPAFQIAEVNTEAYEALYELETQKSILEFARSGFTIASNFITESARCICESLPFQICIPIFGCITNYFRTICFVLLNCLIALQKVIQVASFIALKVITGQCTKARQNLFDHSIYSMATYDDMTAFNKWTAEALKGINDVIQVQHTSMRQHLQDRHFAMEK
jgi:hypothetical protein